MNILGINTLTSSYWSHDSSAAIVSDGKLLAAIEQERLSRRKHDGDVPLDAIQACLEFTGLSMGEIDFIAFPYKPFRSGIDSELAQIDWPFVGRLWSRGEITLRAVFHKLLLDCYMRLGLPRFNWQRDKRLNEGVAAILARYSALPPIRYFDHHMSHAAAAYFGSPFDRCAIATIDGAGGHYSTVLWSVKENRFTRTGAEPGNNSLGYFYSHCTDYLGLGDFGEGKTMGLAGYGDRTVYASQLSSLLGIKSGQLYDYRLNPNKKVIGIAPRTNEPATDPPYPDLAAACQSALEQATNRVARIAIANARSTNLCLGGGVILNCSSNGALAASQIAASIWINSAPGDAGLSIGAAALCAAETDQLDRSSFRNPNLGPEFETSACEVALKQEPCINYRRSTDLFTEVAAALAAGAVIGWFQGRMEFGPRALGNRSILADPRTTAMRDRVNRIKRRELWRPLAPAILEERAREFFELTQSTPFMLFASKVRAEKRYLVPAIVHVDGSARPQTVSADTNNRLYCLIQAFERQTGIPILLNTSFNDAGEPVVCTPQDAIKTFLATGLDMLVCGDFIVNKNG